MSINPDWALSAKGRRELQSMLSEAAITALECRLHDACEFRALNAPARRDQIKNLDTLDVHLANLHQLIAETDEWTQQDVFSRAQALDKRFGPDGLERTNVPFRELLHILQAYLGGTKKAKAYLRRIGPATGYDPEEARSIVHHVGKVFESNNLPVTDAAKGLFVRVIEIVFDEMGIAKGEARKHAGKFPH